MLQLLEFILASPLGAAAMVALQDTIYAVFLLSDCEDCGFNDLGKLLFGGISLAILVGIVVSLLHRRARDGRPDSSGFVSIRSTDRKE